jgi:hypothetical protein
MRAPTRDWTATNVSPDYEQGDNASTGKIVKVTVVQK